MFRSSSLRKETFTLKNHESKPLVINQMSSSSNSGRHIEYLVCAMNCAGSLKYYGKWSSGESACWIKLWQVTKEADKGKVEQLKVTMRAFAAWKKAGKVKGFGQRIGGRLCLNSSSILSSEHQPIVLQFNRIIFNRVMVPPYYDHLLLFLFYLEAYIDAVCSDDDKENVDDDSEEKLPYSSQQLLSILTDCLAMFSVDFWASKDTPVGDLVATFEKLVMGADGGCKKRGFKGNENSGDKSAKKIKSSANAAGKKQNNKSSLKMQHKKKGKESAGESEAENDSTRNSQASQRSALFTKCIKQGTLRTSVKKSRKVFASENSQPYPAQRFFSYLPSK